MMNNDVNFKCLVCGFDELLEPPYDEDEDPSYEICPCCGFQFGYDDLDQGYTFVKYREKWLDSGAKWFSSARKPNKWFLEKKFKNIE
ncbi:hypothetical protein [Bacillus cereus]|nr:hypothetical protein [Bacillus cereus]